MLPPTHNDGEQRDVAANPASSVEAHSGLTKRLKLIRESGLIFLLKKQADQGGSLNFRLLPAGRESLHRIVGMTYSAPARMPVGQRAVIVFRCV